MFEPEMHYIYFLFITASPPALCAGAYGGAKRNGTVCRCLRRCKAQELSGIQCLNLKCIISASFFYYGFAAGMVIAASRLLPCRFIVPSPVDNRTSDYLLPPKGACPACLSWSYPQ